MINSLLVAILFTPTLALGIEKVIPPGGGHGSNWRSNGLCGRHVGGWILQIDIADESIAVPKAVDSILKAKPLQLAPGCSLIGGWSGGINTKEDLEFRVTRWIPESDLERVIKELSGLGEVRYLNVLQSQGTFHDSTVKEYQRAKARWKDDPQLDWDPVEKRIVREQIQYLAPKARSYEETQDKVPLHLVLIRKKGLLELNLGPNPDDVKDTAKQPTWTSLEDRLKSKNVDERRVAALQLTKFAALSFGDTDIGGVGLVLSASSSGTVVVVDVGPESPLRDKISSGDVIEAVDGEAVKGNLAEAMKRLRGQPGKSVTVVALKRSGEKTKTRVRRITLLPSAKRFEDSVLGTIRDDDSIVAELAIRASRSTAINRDRAAEALKQQVKHKTPRVRMAAIQGLQFSLWNGTTN